MKKRAVVLLLIGLVVFFVSCSSAENSPAMYIEAAQLTEEEKQIASLLGLNTEHRIFDFVLDDRVQSMQVNTYELLDGEWRMISGGGGQAFSDAEGRIALGFDNIAEGLRIAVQSEHTGGSTTYTPDPADDFAGMGYATSTLNDPTEIVYEQEIPLVVQIVTAKDEIHSYMVEYFHTPEEYAKHGYEYVYAITVCFSQKTVAELSSAQEA